jgi:hypothetical protein
LWTWWEYLWSGGRSRPESRSSLGLGPHPGWTGGNPAPYCGWRMKSSRDLLGRDVRGAIRYTTREYLDAESRLLTSASCLASRDHSRLDSNEVNQILDQVDRVALPAEGLALRDSPLTVTRAPKDVLFLPPCGRWRPEASLSKSSQRGRKPKFEYPA